MARFGRYGGGYSLPAGNLPLRPRHPCQHCHHTAGNLLWSAGRIVMRCARCHRFVSYVSSRELAVLRNLSKSLA